MTDLLFVYGTLRAGCSNDIARIQPRAVRDADARVRGRLYDLGSYPALLLDEGADWVRGELYRVPADAWEALDALEEPVTEARPDGEYFKLVTAVCLADGSTRDAWVYSANPAAVKLEHLIQSGDWVAHAARQ